MAQAAAKLVRLGPAGDAHQCGAGLLVVQNDLSLVRQVTVDIQPRRGAVEEEVDGGHAGMETRDPVPGVIQALGAVHRAAAQDTVGADTSGSACIEAPHESLQQRLLGRTGLELEATAYLARVDELLLGQ